MSERTATMNRPLRVHVSLMRLFGRVERSEEAVRAVRGDGRAKLIAIRDYTKKAGFAVAAGFPLILKVGGSRNIPKIEEGIAGSRAINVIDVAGRPRSGDVEPCQAVFGIKGSTDADLSVSNPVDASSSVSDLDSRARSNQSRKHAGLRIVVEQFAQALGRQFFHPSILNHLSRARALI